MKRPSGAAGPTSANRTAEAARPQHVAAGLVELESEAIEARGAPRRLVAAGQVEHPLAGQEDRQIADVRGQRPRGAVVERVDHLDLSGAQSQVRRAVHQEANLGDAGRDLGVGQQRRAVDLQEADPQHEVVPEPRQLHARRRAGRHGREGGELEDVQLAGQLHALGVADRHGWNSEVLERGSGRTRRAPGSGGRGRSLSRGGGARRTSP